VRPFEAAWIWSDTAPEKFGALLPAHPHLLRQFVRVGKIGPWLIHEGQA
jgi:hypothetical protein